MAKVTEFFKDSFHDMKESAAAQHKSDKADFEAMKLESKVNFESAKLAPCEVEELNRNYPFSTSDDAGERTKAANARLCGIAEIIKSRGN